jgi:hypothetical protein
MAPQFLINGHIGSLFLAGIQFEIKKSKDD